MKKIRFKLISFLFFVTIALWPKVQLGQSLKISELIKFRSMDNDDLNDLLMSKGWEFVKNENDRMTWAFSKYDNKANSWFYKDKTWEGKVFVEYVFCNTRNISTLKSELSALGFSKKNSESYSTTIRAEYINASYLVTITYTASDPNDNSCDSYSIYLEKRKSKQERLREEKEAQEAKMEEKRKIKECEINKARREKRNSSFSSKIDSFNKRIDSISNITYQKHQLYLMSLDSDNQKLEEERIQDSIEAATRMADSLVALEATMLPSDWTPPPPPAPKFGVTKQSTLIYEAPDELSKAKSGLFKNERVQILYTYEEYYQIRFDYCYEESWDDVGYVSKNDLKLEKPKPRASSKKK